MRMKEGEQLGYDFANGVIRCCLKWFSLGFIISMVILVLANSLNLLTDETDLDGWNRSGLRLHMDHGTGVQYISTKDGHLTVRMIKNPVFKQGN